MCGIAGFVYAKANLADQKEWLNGMLNSLAHRGPDGEGSWLDGTAAMGHRRLSVIDREGGTQPMWDEAGRAVVVFNGEIYNFLELGRELEKRGYRLRTRSDAEVLLYSYLDRGHGCLDALEGMFAFAVWDTRDQTLFAARDRMGEKPFFYAHQGGLFAFASELTALKRIPCLSLKTDPKRLAQYLAYGYVPTPQTIYRGASKLRPGHFLHLAGGRLRLEQYWDLPWPSWDQPVDPVECAQKIRTLASRAVRNRLTSDVPLGAFLSGGVDSSCMVAAMAESPPPWGIDTFSIAFREPRYDESPFARRVSRHFGTNHHEEVLEEGHAVSLLPLIVARQDEPMSDPSVIPTYFLSEITRRRVTVAIGGDGGDELFAGYEHFLGGLLAEKILGRSAKLWANFLGPLSRFLPISAGYVSPRLALEKFVGGLCEPSWLRGQTWLGAFSPEAQAGLWTKVPDDMLDREWLYAETRRLDERLPGSDRMDRMFHLFARQHLLDYILVKVDRCSMMHGLEVRSPLLDRDLVEFAFRIPWWLKMRWGRRKYLLKRAFRDILPPETLRRKKRGFLVPTAKWLRGALRPVVEEYLSDGRLRRQGLFRPEAVRRLIQEHTAGRADHREELWTLLVLQLWLDHHRPGVASASPGPGDDGT